jgi:xanthine dehydrogenase D subunit
MLLNRNSAGKRWKTRPDGPAKVTGSLSYLTDLSVPGMLNGKVLRSLYPHARIMAICIDEALKAPGVAAVLTHKDVPGLNGFGIVNPDQPVFCSEVVRYTGDAIAAIAAETVEQALYALSLIHVDYETLPVVTDPEKALLEDAPQLHPGGNVLHRTDYSRGKAEQAFEDCAYVTEGIYYTPRQMHAYMETEGGVFVPEENGRLTVYAATQHGFKDRMQLSRILAMPEEKIRIVSSPIGGSFGGKDELNVQPYGALLALATGKPVKIHNSRRDSVTAGLKRHPMKLTMKTGMDREGKLLAHEVAIVADTGAYSTLGGPVLNFATEHSIGPYRIPHVSVKGVSVFTNNGVSGEFRGFGGNQSIFALESQLDRLAAAAGMDPWELRRINLRKRDDPGPLDHTVLPSDGPEQVWKSVAASPIWLRKEQMDSGEVKTPQSPWLKRGIGAAMTMHGSGLGYGIPDPGGGRLGLSADGKLEAAFSFEEFGQGITATLEIMLTEMLACDRSDLRIVIGDTDRTPHNGSSTASRSTTVAYMALKDLVPRLSEILCRMASQAAGLPASELQTGPGGVWQKPEAGGCNDTDKKMPSLLITYVELAAAAGEPIQLEADFHFPVTPDPVVGGHYLYTATAVAVEVEVNLLTGAVSVLDQYHAVAAGPVVNPMGYVGQIEGGSVMAQGFTLFEDVCFSEGVPRTMNFDTYLIPGICDISPGFHIDAIQELPQDDPYGPRGIGEVGSVVLAPAITAAVHHAVGISIGKLPISREELTGVLPDLLAEKARTP